MKVMMNSHFFQGCQERHDGFITHISPWSAIRSNDYGYTRMHIFNSTHLYWEQVSDDKVGVFLPYYYPPTKLERYGFGVVRAPVCPSTLFVCPEPYLGTYW